MQPTDSLKISLFLPTQILENQRLAEHIGVLDEVAVMAKDGGFDGLFALQHLGAPTPILQPIPLLAHLSGVAPGMIVGTCVLLIPLHNPFVLAEDLATLDHLSGGRVILGVGAGYREEEFAAAGVAKTTRGARLSSGIRQLKEFWSDDGRDVGTQRVRVQAAQPGGPPILVGTTSRAAMMRAARDADGWLPAPTARMKEIERGATMFQQLREEVGKAPSPYRPIMREVVITDADNRAFEYMQGEYLRYADHGVPIVLRDVAGDHGGAFLVGDTDWVVEELRGLVEAGYNHVILRCGWSGQPGDVIKNQVEALISAVLPALRAADPTRPAVP